MKRGTILFTFLRIKIFAMLFFVAACNNSAKDSFNQLSEELNKTAIEELNLNTLESLIMKIDHHVEKFPNYDRNSLLLDFKTQALQQIEHIAYDKLIESVEQVSNETFEDYETAIKKYAMLKERLQEYHDGGSNQKNVQDAQKWIDKINLILSNISLEEKDYYTAIASNQVLPMEEFLSTYPNSVMRHTLCGKIDEIHYSELLSECSSSPTDIQALNNVISKARSYLVKFRNPDVKGSVNELIAGMESKRRNILETEIEDKLQNLIEMMEDAARDRAENAHPTYVVEMCAARGSNPEVVGYSSTFERLYQVNMKGRFLGIDKRELMVAVAGRIKGDLQQGVTIAITGSRIESSRSY